MLDFTAFARALSEWLCEPIALNGVWYEPDKSVLGKAKLHKYIRWKKINGKWHYFYEEDRRQARSKVELCTSQPLKATPENAGHLFNNGVQNGSNTLKNESALLSIILKSGLMILVLII